MVYKNSVRSQKFHILYIFNVHEIYIYFCDIVLSTSSLAFMVVSSIEDIALQKCKEINLHEK